MVRECIFGNSYECLNNTAGTCDEPPDEGLFYQCLQKVLIHKRSPHRCKVPHLQNNCRSRISCLWSACEPTVKASYSDSKKEFQKFWSFQKLVWVQPLHTFGSTKTPVLQLAIGIQKLDFCVCVCTHTLLTALYCRICSLKGVGRIQKNWDPGSGVMYRETNEVLPLGCSD